MSSSEDTQSSSQDTDSEIEDNGSEHGTGSEDANNRERDETESEDTNSREGDKTESEDTNSSEGDKTESEDTNSSEGDKTESEDTNSSEGDKSNSSVTDKDEFVIRLPSGLYNQVEIYDQYMDFVREVCSTSGTIVYVVSPFIDNITARQLLVHITWGHLCQENLTAKFKKHSTKECGPKDSKDSYESFKDVDDFEQEFLHILTSKTEAELDPYVKACKKSEPQVKLYTRDIVNLDQNVSYLLRKLCDIYLQPVGKHYFHCKWAAVTNRKNTEVLLTSANLTDHHMEKERNCNFQQTDSLSFLTISTEEFKENFLGKLDFCTKEA